MIARARCDPGTSLLRHSAGGVRRKCPPLSSAKTPMLARPRSRRYSEGAWTLAARARSSTARGPLAKRSAIPSLAVTYRAWVLQYPVIIRLIVSWGEDGCIEFLSNRDREPEGITAV